MVALKFQFVISCGHSVWTSVHPQPQFSEGFLRTLEIIFP